MNPKIDGKLKFIFVGPSRRCLRIVPVQVHERAGAVIRRNKVIYRLQFDGPLIGDFPSENKQTERREREKWIFFYIIVDTDVFSTCAKLFSYVLPSGRDWLHNQAPPLHVYALWHAQQNARFVASDFSCQLVA